MTAGAGYEVCETEGRLGVRAWGADRAEAFAQAALGVLALGVAPDGVRERDTRDVRAQGPSLEDLLIAWVGECLYVHEVEGFAVRRVSITALGADVVHGVLHGEEIDVDRHRAATAGRGPSPREATVRTTATGCEVRLTVAV